MFGLDTTLTILLIICLLLACCFEFINGFHDTANAVATVIYTNSLKPTIAVVYSGLLNFIGVMAGGIAVAVGIVNLLPAEVLVDPNPYHGVSIILALLCSAIIWNFGTWFFGIPSSSSHTLIGSILGIGMAFYFLPGDYGLNAVNWDKAKDTGLALLISPLLGFSVSVVVMFIFKRLIKNETIYKEPIPGKRPPIWIRMMLWMTCGLVSFFHGQNDGQKGVGLIMLILIAVLPGYFALDSAVNLQSVNGNLQEISFLMNKVDSSRLALKEKVMYSEVLSFTDKYKSEIGASYKSLDLKPTQRFELRKIILKVSKDVEKLLSGGNMNLTNKELKHLKNQSKEIRKLVDYAPTWVIIIISICLAFGTMFGWQRIVKTIGEKIGKQHMSYAQGASAEIVASLGIGLASWKGVPVSTTHMLSSGVAGSMVAKKGLKNLQKGTIKTIALTWLLTLPVTILLSGGLFLLFRAIL